MLTLLEEMLTVSFHDVSGVTIEDIQKAVKILAPHMILYNYNPFLYFSEFCDDEKEALNPIIRENIGSIINGRRMDDVIKTDSAKYEWSRVPHFYSPYYVYKYATGFISACIIAKNLMEKTPGYHEKYMNFLSAGSSVYPVELLKTVDVDLTKEKTLQSAFSLYEKYLNEFKNLIKEKNL